jgi:hypothetical protein
MNPPKPSSLMRQQQALLAALLAPQAQSLATTADLLGKLDPHDPLARRGLMAYRANGHSLAERSLSAAYPAIEMMLGSENFNALARDLWHRHPPTAGDLARWGATLPELIACAQTLSDAPYLADVARAEWALHRAATAADAAPDLASFAQLASGDATGLALTLAPGTELVHSRFPVATLVMSHRFGEPSLSEAAQKLRQGEAETALIWRERLRPRLALVAPPEAALLQATLAGQDLPGALEAALSLDHAQPPSFDFTHWLTQAVQQGLVVGIGTASTPPLFHQQEPT